MFKFLKRRGKSEREPFDVFLQKACMENPTLNLEDALNKYIKKHRLAVRHSLDEPTAVTDARTKLCVIEESALVDKKYFRPNLQFQDYLETLRKTVKMFNSLPPEVLKRMKEKEQENL